MSYIYQLSTSKKTLVLEPREALIYPFNITGWTDLRVGMIYTFINGTSPDSNYVQETVLNNAISNRFFFGIKNSSNDILPGNSGASFIGISNLSSNANIACNPTNFTLGPISMRMITPDLGQTGESANITQDPNWVATPGTNYAGFWGMQFLYNPATNVISGRRIYDSLGQTQSSLTYLRQRLSALPNTSVYVTGYFNVSGAPNGSGYSLPDAFYLRSPFYSNSMRVAAICIEKFA